MRKILVWTTTLTLSTIVSGTFAHAQGCTPEDWCTYRHDSSRTGSQPVASALSDTTLVSTLKPRWSYPMNGGVGEFWASPIVFNDTIFIGNVNGYFYALDAATGTLKWVYPHKLGNPQQPDPNHQLLGSCKFYGNYGIQSSATYAKIGSQDTVIFGAPDPSAEGGLGSARLFALDAASGTEIWKSDVVARVTGCHSTMISTESQEAISEHHERITNSSPLVLGNKVYVGIHDTGDDPIQQGRVRVVDLSRGHLVPFSYVSTDTPGDGIRGGGVWNSLATDGAGVYFTTGNVRTGARKDPSEPQPEPHPDYALGMIRVDKDSGNVLWAFQPVPFSLDDDVDWAAGAAIMSTSCGNLVASVQKDGWSWAVNTVTGSCSWQFPPASPPIADRTFPHCAVTGYSKFDPNGPRYHGSNNYLKPGAAWNDVLIITTGGESLQTSPMVHEGSYHKLHALNACATTEQNRVRWIADFPDTGGTGWPYPLGAPTVTGGIVFVGTDRGHLIVLGDPSVVPAAGYRCSNTDFTTARDCTNFGYTMVPIPQQLADIAMPDTGMPETGSITALRSEAALARGRVFVGTLHGHVYMFATDPLSITLGAGELSTDHATYGVVTLSSPAPSGGATVTLSPSDPSAIQMPGTVTVPAGLTTLTPAFTITDIYSGPDKSVTITAAYNRASASASLSLHTPIHDPCSHCLTRQQCCICDGGTWVGGHCE